MSSLKNERKRSGPDGHRNSGVAFHLGAGTVALRTPSQEVADQVAQFLPDYALPFEEAEPEETFFITEENHIWSVGIAGAPAVDSFESYANALNGLEQLIHSFIFLLSCLN